MRKRSAFTLVELLVVIGIIALLVSILLPALGRAREIAKRAKCASNLHNIGVTCHMFAGEHGGYFPASYQMPDPSYPYRFPLVISRDDTLETNATTPWRNYGTPWQVFNNYGATVDVFDCPSTTGHIRELDASDAPPEWGAMIWTDYMYIAGLTPKNYGKSKARWGSAVPAVNVKDPRLAETIVAADTVFFTGGSAYQWDAVEQRYQINHPRSGNPNLPDFQNILYGDGHVEGKGREYYPVALNTSTNYSLQHAPAPVGGFMYWGPTLASTTLSFDQPAPVTPTTPTTAPSSGTTTPPKPTTPAPTPILPRPIPGGSGT